MSVLFGDNDPAGRALGSAYTTLAALAFAAVVGPALMLAYWNRWLGLALGLALAGPVAIIGARRLCGELKPPPHA